MDKDKLIAPRLQELDVEVPGVGTVRVRGLNRLQSIHVGSAKDQAGMERRMLALGLIDPVITEDEAYQWQKNSPGGELEPVTNAIAELSGMTKDSRKSNVAGDGADGSGVRVLPSSEAGADGAGTTAESDGA